MNYTKLFYWLTIADNAKDMFVAFIWIFSIISIFSIIASIWSSPAMEDDEDVNKKASKWAWWSTPFAVLFWVLYVFTPNKKDALLIVAGGQTLNFLTTDSTAKQIPHELSSFVVSELKNMASEAKVDLGINDQKKKVIEEVKSLSGESLLERLKTDTTLRNMLLNQ